MNQRLLSVFLFSIVVAGIASFVVYRLISSRIQVAAPVSANFAVIADRDLETGALVHEGDVRRVAWSSPLPAPAITRTEDAVNRGVLTKISKDELMLSTRLAAQGAGAGLAATIPVGMRAVALRVNDVVGLAGFVMPGMRVDVLVAGNSPDTGADHRGVLSRTILQNLEVLSANQRIERNAEGKPEDAQVVNLLVTPDQAEVLSLAAGEAKVQLVLRNPLDTKEQPTQGFSMATLFGAKPEPQKPTLRPSAYQTARTPLRAPGLQPIATPVERPKPAIVEVFNGTKRSEQSFESAPEHQQ